jgi:hypothetical protein
MQGFSLGFCGTLQRCTRLLQYNFTVPLWNLNFISSNQVHGPPATPATTGPRVRPISLIFLYKLFFLSIFSCAQLHVTSVPGPRLSSRQFIKWLSLVRWPMLLLVATSSATANFQTGGGGAILLYGLPSVVCPRQCGTQALRTRAPLDAARWGRSCQGRRRGRLR